MTATLDMDGSRSARRFAARGGRRWARPLSDPSAGGAGRCAAGQTGTVPGWNAYSYVFGPLLAFGGMGVLVLLLRWAFGHGGSLVERPVRPGEPADYGLLVPVAEPSSYPEGERLRRALEDAGLRATLAVTRAGPRVLVFPDDEQRALELLRR